LVAPWLHLGIAAGVYHLRCHSELPPSLCQQLQTLVQEFSSNQRSDLVEQLRDEIQDAGFRAEAIRTGPAYWISAPQVLHPSCVAITEENQTLLQPDFSDWLADVRYQQPFVACLIDGTVAAVCASVRITDRAHEAGVETLKTFRRKGYGQLAVSGWANRVQDTGALTLYSTSDDNLASQGTTSALNMTLIGEDYQISPHHQHRKNDSRNSAW